jgi:type II secretion system protein I
MSPRASQRKGFTLIEVLVAIVLVAVVLPVALAGVGSALRGAELVRRHDVALRVAESRLAMLVADGSWEGSVTSGSCDAELDGEDAIGYQWQLAVSNWRDPSVHVLRLQVGRGRADADGSVTVETLVIPLGAAP